MARRTAGAGRPAREWWTGRAGALGRQRAEDGVVVGSGARRRDQRRVRSRFQEFMACGRLRAVLGLALGGGEHPFGKLAVAQAVFHPGLPRIWAGITRSRGVCPQSRDEEADEEAGAEAREEAGEEVGRVVAWWGRGVKPALVAARAAAAADAGEVGETPGRLKRRPRGEFSTRRICGSRAGVLIVHLRKRRSWWRRWPWWGWGR